MEPIYNYQKDASFNGHWESKIVKADSREDFSEIEGPGIVKKLWLTTFPSSEKEDLELAHSLVINIYWENSVNAAVSVPLADFFCQPLKLQAIENCFFHSTNNQLLFACTIPMPFRKVARFELVNNSDKEVELFYGIDVEYKKMDSEAMYLHAHWQAFENLDTEESFSILPETKGKGRYLGTHLSLSHQQTTKDWPWYTRPVSVYLDAKSNDENPSLYIKTIDDFFDSAWWDREEEHNTYAYQYIGRPLVETDGNGNLSLVLYRYHVKDPLWFEKSISVEIGKNWNWGNQEIAPGNWATTSFFYLDAPGTL